jgi:predicted Rossmann fold nucleotide-binding protein DprA/Smf involved in DNA uptake
VLSSFGIDSEVRDVGADPLLDLLPGTADELVRRTGRPAAEVAAALVALELDGRATVHDGVYRRTS